MRHVRSPKSYSRFLYQELRPYRVYVPVVCSIVIGLSVAVAAVVSKASSGQQLLRAVAAHASILVETNDVPELQRLVASIARESSADLLIVNSDEVVASSRSYGEIGLPVKLGKFMSRGSINISTTELINMSEIRRTNGPPLNAQAIMISPLAPLLKSSGAAFVIVLLVSLSLANLYARRMSKVARRLLEPIKSLNDAIATLVSVKDDLPLRHPLEIREFELIRRTLLETKRALDDASERAAQARAKELAAESYQRLLHDLYTPIAALKEATKVLGSSAEVNRKEPAQLRALRLSEQILNQITATKANLGAEPKILAQGDIRSSVVEAIEQVQLARATEKPILIKKVLPTDPVIAPHDGAYIQRAVANLLSNAIHACRSQVQVKVTQGISQVSIEVSDDGEGLNESDVSLLIQGRLPSRDGSRLGLGLPSANHTARLHGGRLIYRRSEMGGAAFEMRF